MNIFDMVMEAMQPSYNEEFCGMEAMESDTECFAMFQQACGMPAYKASDNRVRMMSATEALSTLSDHARIADSMETKEQKMDYSAAFEAINTGLDTSINPEQKQEILDAQRQEALSFYGALECFMSGEDPAMEGKLWDSFMNKGAGRAYETGSSYDEDYKPRGHMSLGDFQLHVVTDDKGMNALHARYPHIAFKRGPIARAAGKILNKFNEKDKMPVQLFWIDPVNPEDPTAAVCVATADLNPKWHVIHDISVRSEFQRYGLMKQILDYVVKEYQCNEAITEVDETLGHSIAEEALKKTGFTEVYSGEYSVKGYRKGATLNPSYIDNYK